MGSAAEKSPLAQLSDEEIIAELQTFKPIDPNSERNIWAFWDRGIAACKPWCQRNIISWARRHSSWTVRVLDTEEGSPNHYSNYIPNTVEFFPDAFIKRTMAGIHVGPHAADLIRLPLLYLYGGVWLDVGFTLFRGLDDLCWYKLEDAENTLELAGFKMTISSEAGMFWNGFIASRKSCAATKHWHDTFLKVWEGTDSTTGMSGHPLLRHLPRYEVPSATGKPPAFQYAHFVDYLAQMFCLERLRHTRDPVIEWDGPAVFSQNVLLYECVSEVYWAQHLTHWDGRKQFDLLSRQREGAEQDDKFKEADAFVNGILGMSSTMKLSHGLVTEEREYLARIWDEPENVEADRKPGTFAAHMRWASIHFQQDRELSPVALTLREDALLTGGLFEAVGKPHPHWETE
ncbi:putative glycosyl transferase [Lachnellula hyalina]|uniref:Putative glycosyl transferase n=1 Tax=Lachnellula hyalina TaxID=1316788 RepID=A0A8H8TVX0_9HELO|nr:putative glycosyl transferase [Lachnellula hyalina]TVY24264.1 putative glycosyl transferase [Lachnellula hyalina]